MRVRLFAQMTIKFTIGVILAALLLFVSAGTVHFWNAWLLMGILFLPMLGFGLVLLFVRPNLLRLRLQAKETQGGQTWIVRLTGSVFVLGFLAAGLDFRFQWTHLPAPFVIGAAVCFLLFYLLYAEVLRENRYLSRTIAVQEGQTVIQTGLYRVVRHPMYAASVGMFLAMPLVLGSLVSFAVFLVYPFLIAERIRKEEAFLCESLAGYPEYRQKVRYKLIPYLW